MTYSTSSKDYTYNLMPMINESLPEYAKSCGYESYGQMHVDQYQVDDMKSWYETTYGMRLKIELIDEEMHGTSATLLPDCLDDIVVDQEKYCMFVLKYR